MEGEEEQGFSHLDEYHYAALSLSSVRLLTIAHGQDSIISCSLSTAVLGSSIQYVALSYTWGNPLFEDGPASDFSSIIAPRSSTIMCDGKQLKVTKNLDEALFHFRNRPEIAKLWIDAICINQDDISERSAQVLIMSDIYSSAEYVLAWLGPATDRLPHTLENMRKLAAVPETKYELAERYEMSDPSVYALLGMESPLTNPDIKDLAIFFMRSWFRRIWVLQEVVLAKKIILQVGDNEIEWDVIVQVSDMINVTRWNSSLSRSLQEKDKPWRGTVITNSPMIMRDLRNRTDKYTSFTDCLTLTRSFEATIAHDHIYALLGLVQPFVKSICTPDYAEPLDLVLTKAAYAQIRESRSLYILNVIEDASLRNIKSLPSWVPDLTSKTTTSRLEGHYHACRNLKYEVPQAWTIPGNLNIRLLTATGLQWDSIVELGDDDSHWYSPGLGIVASLNLIKRIPSIYPNSKEPRLTALWRTLISNRSSALQYPAHGDMAQGFRYYLKLHVGDVWAENEASPGDLTALRESQKLLEDLAVADGHDLVPYQDEITELSESFMKHAQAGTMHIPLQPCQAFSQRMFVALYGRRLFATRKGYLGIAAKAVLPGDTVWILPGLRAPAVLREAEHGRYKFVGVSYVHGIMDGEALNDEFPLRAVEIE